MAEQSAISSRAQTLVTLAVVVAGLYFAADVLIPVALALLLAFLLAPLVVRLRRVGLGRIGAIAVAVVSAFTVITVVGAVVVTQVYELADRLPQYQHNIQQKLHAFTGDSNGLRAHLNTFVQGISDELSDKFPTAPSTTSKDIPPVVQTVSSPQSSLSTLWVVLTTVGKNLAIAGIVLIFTIFMLLEREDLRDRMLRLAGRGNLMLTTQALDDAGQRVSRYLRMQLLINICYGLPIGLGLYFIGVPNAFLWGLLATLLRFIPYLGPWIAALVPLALCFAIDPGWTKLGLTAGLYIVIELVTANFIEPWLYGSSTGISAIGVLVAAVFWAWLWGVVGLLLSTPLTVCIIVLGRYVPQLRFLTVMLGDQPGLSPPERYYQRMLASEFEDVSDLVDDYLKDHPIVEAYDNVIVPALVLAGRDHDSGQLDDVRLRFMIEHTRDLIEDLATRSPLADPPITVACMPARDRGDELCGLMLAHLLQARGVGVKVLSAERFTGERLEKIAELGVGFVCLSCLPPIVMASARSVGKRMRSAAPNVKIITGLWTVKGSPVDLRSKLTAQAADNVVTTLAQAIDTIASLAPATVPAKINPPPRPAALLQPVVTP